MLKQLAVGGAVVAAFAGLGLATPAQAETPYPGERKINISNQSGNTITCRNSAIGDINILLLPLTPVTSADRENVDCGIRANQQ
jgi:hypothetical protein